MEARIRCVALIATAFFSLGAGYRTENFIVTAPSPDLAREVAETAESMRHDLAVEWLGGEIAPWQDKCPITVHVGPHLGAGGATSFMFENGRPFGWTMSIQGSRERILDSVLPHEVTHTIFATHFGRPLPRWADEGACTTVEDISERQKQHDMLYEFLTTHRGIAFNEMFAMTEYPSDVLPLYSQGYSLARFFIAQGGQRKFIDYVGDGMKWNNWTKATQTHYGYGSLSELQVTWLDWVRQGSPALPRRQTLVAQQDRVGSELVPIPAAGLREDATPVVPANNELADTASRNDDAVASSKGWYSRVRDEAIAGRNEVQQASFSEEPAVKGSAERIENAGRTVSRPQPVGRPGQIILEWSQPPTAASSVGGSNSAVRNVPAARQPYRLIPGFRGTILR